MDEIRALQEALAKAQESDSAYRLSDRNAVDLIMKLQQMKRLDLIYSLNGKEIITPKHLKNELQDEILVNNGRVTLAELQTIVNVDMSYVDKAIMELVRSSTELSIVGDEVVMQWYLDGIMEDVNETLQEIGQMVIADIAQRYGLPVEFITNVVQTRLGKQLHSAELKGATLYTQLYMDRQTARIRGIFNAVTSPIVLPQVATTYEFEMRVLEDTLQELIASGQICGTLRGREYTPYLFMEKQKESMYSFFEQNGYLEHSRAAQLQVARPFEFLKKRFPDAIALNSSVVNMSILIQIEAAIEDTVQENTFMDVRSLVPAAISASDIALLVSKTSFCKKQKALQLADTIVISTGFIDQCLDRFKSKAETSAKDAAAKRRRTGAKAAPASSPTSSDMEEREGKKGKKGKKGKSVPVSQRDGSDDEEDVNFGKKGKGKKARGKKGKQAPQQEQDSVEKKAVSESITPSKEEISELLCEWCDDTVEFADELADELFVRVDRIYAGALATALTSIHKSAASNLRQLRSKFEELFTTHYGQLILMQKSLSKVKLMMELEDQVIQSVEEHMLDTLCVPFAALINAFVCESNGIIFEGDTAINYSILASSNDKHQKTGIKSWVEMRSLSPEQKLQLERELSKDLSSSTTRLWMLATAGRRSVDDFVDHVTSLIPVLQLPLQKTDRKTERQVIFGYRQRYLADSAQATDSLRACQLFLQLLFQQSTGLPLTLPPDAESLAQFYFTGFKDSMPSHLHSIVEEFMAKVQAAEAAEEELLEKIREISQTKDLSKLEL